MRYKWLAINAEERLSSYRRGRCPCAATTAVIGKYSVWHAHVFCTAATVRRLRATIRGIDLGPITAITCPACLPAARGTLIQQLITTMITMLSEQQVINWQKLSGMWIPASFDGKHWFRNRCYRDRRNLCNLVLYWNNWGICMVATKQLPTRSAVPEELTWIWRPFMQISRVWGGYCTSRCNPHRHCA